MRTFAGVPVAMWDHKSHSVTCHPTQVNTPHLNSSQTGSYSGGMKG